MITRRRFIAGAGALALGAGAWNPARARAGERPNLLWLVSDDHSPHIGAYGDPLARTPALDRLAAEGVLYERCSCPAPVCAPSRFSIISGLEATSCGPAHHQRAEGNIPAWLRGFPAFLREAGYYTAHRGKRDYNAPIEVDDAWDDATGQAHWRGRPPGAPFFAVVNFGATHEGQLFPGAAEPLPDGVRPEDVRLPAYHPDEPELRRDRALHYDQVTRLDGQVAGWLAQLEDDGLADSTIVFFYGDNGGPLPRGKRYCYESGQRVPLIARFPAPFRHLAPGGPGTRVAAAVSTLDLGPTMLSLAGVTVPDYMHGNAFAGAAAARGEYSFGFRGRMDERYDMSRTVSDGRYRYIRNYRPDLPYGQHNEYMWRQTGVRVWEQRHREGALNAVQRAFWEPKPVDELYDLERDVDEVVNLAGDPAHAAVLGRLRRALEAHMVAVRDNGFIPEGSPLEGYDTTRDPRAYPIRRIIGVADAALARDPRSLGRLQAWLADPHEVVRYWAALGCVMLGEQAAGARDALLSRLADASVPVRIVAGEALVRVGERERGLGALGTILTDDPHPRFRLQAANSLDHLGRLAEPALPALERARIDPDVEVRRAASYTRDQLVRDDEGRYRTLADAFGNVGTSDDADYAAADFDGAGNSFSRQALAAAGLVPGGDVVYDGIRFTWPDVPAGRPDNVLADGQQIVLSGTGSVLGCLGACSRGPGTVSADGTLHYEDGTTSAYTLTLDDWFHAPVENEAVAAMPYLNANGPRADNGVGGRRTQDVYVFYASVPVAAGKALAAVELPAVSSSADGGRAMHVFALGLR